MTTEEKVLISINKKYELGCTNCKQVMEIPDNTICLGSAILKHYEIIHCHYDFVLDKIVYISLTNKLN